MLTSLDYVLDRITMYRLVLYALLGYIGLAAVMAAMGRLPFSPVALLASTALLVALCWAANTVLATIFRVPTNVESVYITALILALILDPAQSVAGLAILAWAAVWAMAAKYIIALHDKHLFNPAAIAVAITGFGLGHQASWWVGTGSMLPGVLIGGALIVRKLRQEGLVAAFLAAALVTVSAVSLAQRLPLTHEIQQLLVESPLLFLGTIMLTEPLTMPPTKALARIYAVITGALFVPQIHLGALYSTPELALLIGNAFSYVVSPRERVTLTLARKYRLARDTVDFVFTPSRSLTFAPGQYIECTLAHAHPDARGNRRFFTLASSPTEADVHLGVRFYERGSSFKRALLAMRVRGRVMGMRVAGDFTLPAEPTQKLAFIAGGIGITPYRSMLKYLIDTRQPRDITLLYAQRTVDDIVYKDVLDEAQRQLGVKVALTLTDQAGIPRTWSGYRGRVDRQMIRDTIPDYAERRFYVSGPPDMVNAAERELRSLGVRSGQIKKDFFPGLI
jgi:glycine betaine catabolism B